MNAEHEPATPRKFSDDAAWSDAGLRRPEPAGSRPPDAPGSRRPDPAGSRPPPQHARASARTRGSNHRRDPADPDALILALAARQHGVLARRQLRDAGVPVSAIDNRVRNGRLVAVHRAVYRVPGPVRGRFEREMAAVLACGPGARLSHHSAAGLLGLPLAASSDGRPEVLVVDGYRRPGPSIRVHRVRCLDPRDRAEVDGVPVTGAARTLLDMAPRMRPRTLEQAVAWAQREGVADRSAVEAVVARYPRARGAGLLRVLLALDDGPAFVRSEAEERLLHLVARARLPKPRSNVVVEGIEVDFLWPGERLVVEVDGRRYHGRDAALERDRRRDAALARAGYRVIRVTWEQLCDEREAVSASISGALASA